MSNRKYLDTKNLASKGRFGDIAIRNVEDKPSHVNAWEATIIDETSRLGRPDLGEALVKEIGAGTINPKTGLTEYFQPENIMFDGGGGSQSWKYAGSDADKAFQDLGANTGTNLGNMISMGGKAAGALSKVGGIAGTAGGSALASVAAAAGPLALVAGVGMMLKGAADKQKAAEEKKDKLEQGIENINRERVNLGEKAKEKISNIWEGVGSKLEDIRYSAGGALEGVGDKIEGAIKKGKGLATGAPEKIEEVAKNKLQEGLLRQTEKLEDAAVDKIDEYSEWMEGETTDMSRQTSRMKDEIGDLKTGFWENLI
tara:strand:+ start:330 stop:1268 length:939 start_codon:yes stop_codon:yes gene_type:complete